MFIYPYMKGSKSIKGLKEGLNLKLIKLENSKFKGARHKKVINWGNTNPNNQVSLCQVLNPPELIRRASNKREFFMLCSSADAPPRTPAWTTAPEVAKEGLERGEMWLARTKLAGHSGEGIVIMEKEEDFVQAPLYTKYIKKKDEFRVHIFRGEVFDIQRKAKKVDEEVACWKVRNHTNGFIYMRGDSDETPQDVLDQAVKALNATGLDFGAVDVIWNSHYNEAYVLEVNTAPGLTGTTLDNYVSKFREWV